MRWVIIGNGVWARALGATLLRNEVCKLVRFWARNPRAEDESSHIDLLKQADILLWAVPTSVLGLVPLPEGIPVLLACKGVRYREGKWCLPADWFGDRPCGVLSGPTFANEVNANLPSAIVLAGSRSHISVWADQLRHPHFRVYLSVDIAGVQIGGAIKNVIAIANGLCMGLGLGHNASAALITRGLCEVKRIGAYFGAQHETLNGLSGLGDLMLTATSLQSRNTQLGHRIARGSSLKEAMDKSSGVVEGIHTIQALHQGNHQLYLPLVHTLYRILFEGAPLESCIRGLLHQQRNVWEFASSVV